MRFYLILFFCVSVIFTSCKDNSVPKDIVPMPNLAALLTDLHTVDGSLYEVPQLPDTLAKHGLGLYMAVFKFHHIDTATFRKSLKYYSVHPDLLNTIYAGVERRVQKRIDSLQKHKPKIKVNADSVKRMQLQRSIDSVKISTVKLKASADSLAKAVKKKKKIKKPVKKRKLENIDALPQQ